MQGPSRAAAVGEPRGVHRRRSLPAPTARGWPRSSSPSSASSTAARRCVAPSPTPRARGPTRRSSPSGSSQARSSAEALVVLKGVVASAGAPSVTSPTRSSGMPSRPSSPQAEADEPCRPGRGRALPLRADRRGRPGAAHGADRPAGLRPTSAPPSSASLLRGQGRPGDPRAGPPGRASPRAGVRFDRVLESTSRRPRSRREQQTATVTSAVPLTDEDRGRLAAGLAAIYGGTVHVNTVVDPRVMGGVKVEIGDERHRRHRHPQARRGPPAPWAPEAPTTSCDQPLARPAGRDRGEDLT